jgi:hypothetical protein
MHPRLFVDSSWEAEDKPKIVKYLRSGVRWNAFMGHSYCRFEGGPPDKEMGSADLTDGVWLWPEGLHVYVERYHVRLPDEFVEHMRRNGFRIPAGLSTPFWHAVQRMPPALRSKLQIPEGISNQPVPEHVEDMSFWEEWCSREAGRRSKRD